MSPLRPTCRFCGKTLRERIEPVYERREWVENVGDLVLNQAGHIKIGDRPTGEFGYNGDGLFCTLRCGYWFALNAAKALDMALVEEGQ